MEQKPLESFEGALDPILELLMRNYWSPMHQYISSNLHLLDSAPGFLFCPEKVIFYIGKTHLGIEYTGAERITEIPEKISMAVQLFDYTEFGEDFLEKIIGFKYDDSTSKFNMPLPNFSEGIIMPTNRGSDELEKLRWRFEAQDAMICFNSGTPVLIEKEFTRLVNGLFFDADEKGLKTRHIKWIDFVPVYYDDTDKEKDVFGLNLAPYQNLATQDCHYEYPVPSDYDYQHSKLQKINRLLELVGNKDTSETEITRFLASPENHFILNMRFGGTAIHSELICDWQSEKKDQIKPDFFVVQSDGFANIVEFKLPTTATDIIGSNNRETFTAKVNSYISQVRTYRNYFEDPNNRKWFEGKYGFKVYRPRKILVIGRRWEFDSDTWREIISDHDNLEILTYDDLVDGVVAQLYM
jgi:hypothetical protein